MNELNHQRRQKRQKHSRKQQKEEQSGEIEPNRVRPVKKRHKIRREESGKKGTRSSSHEIEVNKQFRGGRKKKFKVRKGHTDKRSIKTKGKHNHKEWQRIN